MRWLISAGLLWAFFLPPYVAAQQSSASASENSAPDGRPISQTDKDAIAQAIVDEMYANDLQGYVIDVGREISTSEYELSAYFQPVLYKDNTGFIIYKLMPYGEVYRLFSIEPDGLAILYGRLRDRFPPTHPSYLTVYIDDDDLCRMKKDWGKSYFTVELKPSAKRIADARARERKRKS